MFPPCLRAPMVLAAVMEETVNSVEPADPVTRISEVYNVNSELFCAEVADTRSAEVVSC